MKKKKEKKRQFNSNSDYFQGLIGVVFEEVESIPDVEEGGDVKLTSFVKFFGERTEVTFGWWGEITWGVNLFFGFELFWGKLLLFATGIDVVRAAALVSGIGNCPGKEFWTDSVSVI